MKNKKNLGFFVLEFIIKFLFTYLFGIFIILIGWLFWMPEMPDRSIGSMLPFLLGILFIVFLPLTALVTNIFLTVAKKHNKKWMYQTTLILYTMISLFMSYVSSNV